MSKKNIHKVDLIKCDIEGAELLAFKGAINTIKNSRPVVYCEIIEEYCNRYNFSSEDVFNYFINLDYNPFLISNNNIELTNYELFKDGDVLFVPSEINAQ